MTNYCSFACQAGHSAPQPPMPAARGDSAVRAPGQQAAEQGGHSQCVGVGIARADAIGRPPETVATERGVEQSLDGVMADLA